MKKPLSLYVHIPFCVKKCDYCDFLSAPADASVREAYVKALIREIQGVSLPWEEDRIVRTVFFGGGTPSVLLPEQIGRILEALRERFAFAGSEGLSLQNEKRMDTDAEKKGQMNTDPGKEDELPEISMEVNPGTVTRQQCTELCKLGINRFSIGLQSADDAVLQRIGRIHTYEQFLNTYGWLREAGCKNINVDLMSALPGQSVEEYCDGLHKVAKLEPEHISAYSLILEEGTPLYDRYAGGAEEETWKQSEEELWKLPDEEQERQMYYRTSEILDGYGYRRYEISNYAKEGFACRHNCVYWQRGEYLGFGLGAASLIFADMPAAAIEVPAEKRPSAEWRWKNTMSLHNYMNDPLGLRKEEQLLSRKDQMEEFMFLGLRMMEGVSKDWFRSLFKMEMENVFGPVLSRYKDLGLLQEQDGCVMLTRSGIDVSNVIFADFILDK